MTSPAVATAYLDPTTSNEAPVSTPFGDSTASPRSVLTNDLGTLEEGVLMLVGRLDDVVNLKGKKVSPEEVERVITSIDGVHAAYVFAEPQDHRPNVLRLKALVAADEAIDRATILRQCRDQLADHKLPRSITVVSRLPVTERGKLDRTAARRLCRKI